MVWGVSPDARWAVSSAAERYIHIVEVRGSNPLPPTIVEVGSLVLSQRLIRLRRKILYSPPENEMVIPLKQLAGPTFVGPSIVRYHLQWTIWLCQI